MKSRNYIPELDGLRGLAIALVMLYHLWRYTGPNPLGRAVTALHGVGWVGVDIFFALSGFLIAGILLDTSGRDDFYRRFYIARALRIFPLYYLVLTAVAVAGLLNRWFDIGIDHAALANPGAVWAQYLYVTNFVVAWAGEDYVPIDIAWSLAIEEQFYLVAPLLVRTLSLKNLERLLWGILATAPLLRWITWHVFDTGYLPVHLLPFGRMDTIAAGCLAAVLLRRRAGLGAKPVTLALAAAACSCLALLSRGDGFYIVIGYSLPALAVASLIYQLRAEGCPMLNAFLGWAPLRVVGRLSYGLYLFHLPVRFLVDSITSMNPSSLAEAVARTALILVLSLAAAWLSWTYFEAPIRAWKHHLGLGVTACTRVAFGRTKAWPVPIARQGEGVSLRHQNVL